MLTNKNDLINKLKKGWVFDILTPLLFEQLKKHSSMENVSVDDVTVLMLRQYRIIDDASVSLIKKNIVKSDDNVSFVFDEMKVAAKLIDGDFKAAHSTKEFNKSLKNAIESLLIADPKLSSIFHYVNKYILVKHANFRSASHPYLLFSIVLNLDSFGKFKNDLALSIIHELAHQELFLLNLVDRLVTVENTYRLVHAPYQDKLRPPIGRLHSCHALYRMIQYSRVLDIPIEKIIKFEKIFLENIASFHENELTSFSGEMLEHVYQKRN